MRRLRARHDRGVRAFGLALLIGLAGTGGAVNGREGDIQMTDEPETTDDGSHAASEGADASPANGAEHTNRLIHEKSPYLLQHAHNPVEWYPWGPAALAAAREQQKPIFLSVGYSTCHWCHVMAHESFENDSIAAIMNEHYINVKVDREERPDLDMLYMNAVQAMTGRGGWPMSVWLTPDLEPFFAGTYFPPTEGHGMPGFATLLRQIADAWENDRDRVAKAGGQIAEAMSESVRRIVESAGDGTLDAGVLERAHRELLSQYDAEHGGFGGAPKFPMPHYARYLLRYAHRSGHDDARRMVFHTLDRMASGGIHDHLAGGFHRYSTDRVWLAPHFEKMLYDQAGLALLYTDAWLVSGEPVHRAVAEGILTYVSTTLTHPEGGFYSAEDADSEGEEGTFYVWSPSEVDEVLGERGAAFRSAYDVSEAGNWEGKSILRTATLDPILDEGFAADRAKLLARRDARPRPHLDDKIITAWNGFMIEAFAHAGRAFGEERYLDTARRAASFVADSLWSEGDLLRHHRDGAADVAAYLEDYAYLGRGLLALYESTFETRWLALARKVAARMAERFDHESGVLAFYGTDQEQLLTPVVESHDGAMPSGVSVAANLLLRLGHLTADRTLESRGERILDAYAGILSQQPTMMLELVAALDFSLGPITEVVVAGDAGDETVAAMWRTVHGRYRPNTVCVQRPATDAPELVRLVPYVKTQTAVDGAATAYVCEGYTCQLPVQDAGELAKRLDGE